MVMEHPPTGNVVITAASCKIPLQCHSASHCNAVNSVHVTMNREASSLQLHYEIAGDIEALKIPVPLQSLRYDELWRHTCAEMFIALPGTTLYGEYNFSPSSRWAAYEFAAYRQDRRQLLCDNPIMTLVTGQNKLMLAMNLVLPEPYAFRALQMGLCMVIEDNNEQCSYWALQHDGPRADFHRRENWIQTA